MSDAGWMAQALALAALGEGTTRPNPLVGCVVVHGGEVVGSGFHRAAGEPHAEALALSRAGDRARGSTLYVNLEPCAHQGRTGPCAEAIIRAGVARVVSAIVDPNAVVNGRGLAALRTAGIEVTEGVLAAEARALNAPFLSTHERGLPTVTLKAAQSLDGRIAAGGGRSSWVSGAASRRYAHRLRYRHDAVLVGAGTVRRDNPRLTVRLPGVHAARHRVVLAPTLDVDPAALAFEHSDPAAPPTRVYVAEDCPDAAITRFQGTARVVRVASSPLGLDLEAVLRDLHDVGVQSILVEGGGKTAGTFVRSGFVDEVVLFVAGRWFGSGDATPVVDLPAVDSPEHAWRLERPTIIPLGEDTVISGRLKGP